MDPRVLAVLLLVVKGRRIWRSDTKTFRLFCPPRNHSAGPSPRSNSGGTHRGHHAWRAVRIERERVRRCTCHENRRSRRRHGARRGLRSAEGLLRGEDPRAASGALANLGAVPRRDRAGGGGRAWLAPWRQPWPPVPPSAPVTSTPVTVTATAARGRSRWRSHNPWKVTFQAKGADPAAGEVISSLSQGATGPVFVERCRECWPNRKRQVRVPGRGPRD